MILNEYGQPWKFAHAADTDRRRGPQFSTRTNDIHKLIGASDARTIRSLSSRLYTNMGIPRAAIGQKADYSVGEAWRPIYVGPSDFADGKAVANFLAKSWMPACDVRGGCFDWHKLLELTSIAIDRDGDAFWMLVQGNDKFPRIQQIPAHRVGDGPDTGGKVSSGKWNGYDIRDGVIQTKEGRAVAYRVLVGADMKDFKDIPASDLIHIFDPGYQDQSRGLPAFTHALEDLKACLAASADERVRQAIVSRLFLTVFNETGGPDMDDPRMFMQTGVSGSNTGIAAEEIPGGIVYLTAGAGEKMEQMAHNTPGDMWENFQNRMIRMSLAGVCWPYSLVWLPSGQGTAERAEVLKARRAVVRRQKQLAYAARRALAWAYSVFVQDNRVPMLDHPFAWEFSKPPRLTVDDGRESKAELEELSRGVLNVGNITESKLGLSEDEFYLARAHSIAKRKLVARQVAEEYSKSSGFEIEIKDAEMNLTHPNELMAKVQEKQIELQEEQLETDTETETTQDDEASND